MFLIKKSYVLYINKMYERKNIQEIRIFKMI